MKTYEVSMQRSIRNVCVGVSVLSQNDNLSQSFLRHQSTLQLRLICFRCCAFLKSFALSSIMLTAYLSSLKLFLSLLLEDFAKQANLNVSGTLRLAKTRRSGFCSSLFVLLCLDLQENWSKLD